jgi:prepilin-type N-terminal cleavage/methylation domain-containing protein
MFSKLKKIKNTLRQSSLRQSSGQGGFTILELIVVTAIFGILTSILMFNYGDFTDRVLSTNMAYEIALTARQAQVFGLGVRGSGGEFGSAYGIHIALVDGETKSIDFFNDIDSSGMKEGACNGSGECLEQLVLQRNIAINSLLVKDATGCTTAATGLSITFKRPNPDAIIKNHSDLSEDSYEYAEIGIKAPRSDALRYVIIHNTGQISVQDNSLCNPS